MVSADLPQPGGTSGEEPSAVTFSTQGWTGGPKIESRASGTPPGGPPSSSIDLESMQQSGGTDTSRRSPQETPRHALSHAAPLSSDAPAAPEMPAADQANVARPERGGAPSRSAAGLLELPGNAPARLPVRAGLPARLDRGTGTPGGEPLAVAALGSHAPVEAEMPAAADSNAGQARKDDARPQTAIPGQVAGWVPPLPDAVSSGLSEKRTRLPQLAEASNAPAPVETYTAFPASSAERSAQRATRAAGPGAEARPPSIASTRLGGNVAPERQAARADGAPQTPPEAAGSAREGQGEGDSWEPAVRAGTGNQSESPQLAFGGRLIPVAATDARASADRGDPQPRAADRPSRPGGVSAFPAVPPDSIGEKAVTAIEATGPTAGQQEGNPRPRGTPAEEDAAPIERLRKPEAARAAELTSSAADRTVLDPSHGPQESAANRADRSQGEPAPEPQRASARVESEAPKPPTTTHDIKLEVASGDQRVEVHLVERGGDVHVAVRTPDTHLAGELRENLPALSTRLEQTGLRPEEWHTTTPASGEWHRQVEHSAGSSANDPQGQSRQDTRQRQGDPEPRQPQVMEEQPNRKQKGKDFAWFMSSLR